MSFWSLFCRTTGHQSKINSQRIVVDRVYLCRLTTTVDRDVLIRVKGHLDVNTEDRVSLYRDRWKGCSIKGRSDRLGTPISCGTNVSYREEENFSQRSVKEGLFTLLSTRTDWTWRLIIKVVRINFVSKVRESLKKLPLKYKCNGIRTFRILWKGPRLTSIDHTVFEPFYQETLSNHTLYVTDCPF